MRSPCGAGWSSSARTRFSVVLVIGRRLTGPCGIAQTRETIFAEPLPAIFETRAVRVLWADALRSPVGASYLYPSEQNNPGALYRAVLALASPAPLFERFAFVGGQANNRRGLPHALVY